MSQSRRSAFTLVELLVVIGIIALLISILLPALNSARKQAQAVKCLASLKEIGNAFQMYAIDSKGYYPPAQLRIKDGIIYNLYGTEFPADGNGAYWYNFLNKYVSKEKIGNEDNGSTVDNVKTKSIFWGCPSYDGYDNGGTNRVQTGYGMNGYPTFDTNYPRTTTTPNPLGGPPVVTTPEIPPPFEWAWNQGPTPTPDLRWSQTENRSVAFIKQRVWTKRGSARLLIADSRFWLSEASRLTTTIIPAQTLGNVNGDAGETAVDLWRHGKSGGTTVLNSKLKNIMKGKFAFNILYADGHVATASEPSEAYKSIRMKFPG